MSMYYCEFNISQFLSIDPSYNVISKFLLAPRFLNVSYYNETCYFFSENEDIFVSLDQLDKISGACEFSHNTQS